MTERKQPRRSVSRYLLSAVLGALILAGACSGQTSRQSSEGETHWLRACSAAGDCEPEFACVCGVCTRDCGLEPECPTDSRCRPDDATDVTLLCGEDAVRPVCLPVCVRDDDCPGQLQVCVAGSCVPRSRSVCELPADAGPCEAAMPRFFFDTATGSCQPFTYGGCDGNRNNFESLRACQSACGGAGRDAGAQGGSGGQGPDGGPGAGGNGGSGPDGGPRGDSGAGDLCNLPPEIGPCLAAFLRYYYDPQSGRCQEFTWGGCGGNDNNFESLVECEQRCP